MIDLKNDLLVVIDIQNDFCPGGSLAIAGGDETVPVANRLIDAFDHVAMTQDWHPAGHASFASSHQGRRPFDEMQLYYGAQTLWPDHCVQGTDGAEFHPDLEWTKAEIVVRKGYNPALDSYSAFFENDKTTATGLGGYARERGFRRVVTCGLALDVCVAFSSLDARRLGLDVVLVTDACRAIDPDGNARIMLRDMQDAGVIVTDTSALHI